MRKFYVLLTRCITVLYVFRTAISSLYTFHCLFHNTHVARWLRGTNECLRPEAKTSLERSTTCFELSQLFQRQMVTIWKGAWSNRGIYLARRPHASLKFRSDLKPLGARRLTRRKAPPYEIYWHSGDLPPGMCAPLYWPSEMWPRSL